jgi:hypothetical protein
MSITLTAKENMTVCKYTDSKAVSVRATWGSRDKNNGGNPVQNQGTFWGVDIPFQYLCKRQESLHSDGLFD